MTQRRRRSQKEILLETAKYRPLDRHECRALREIEEREALREAVRNSDTCLGACIRFGDALVELFLVLIKSPLLGVRQIKGKWRLLNYRRGARAQSVEQFLDYWPEPSIHIRRIREEFDFMEYDKIVSALRHHPRFRCWGDEASNMALLRSTGLSCSIAQCLTNPVTADELRAVGAPPLERSGGESKEPYHD